MREFRYRALKVTGETITGFRQSLNSMTLGQELATQNLILLDSKPQLKLLGASLKLRGRIKRRELRDFTLHMATCLSSGIPIVTALRDIEVSMAGHRIGEIIVDIREEISSGSQVAEALAHHPEAFSDLYIALIRAGEGSGSLDVTFAELVNYLEWSDELQSKVRQAMIYPAILASAAVGLFLLMVVFVIPRFMGIFSELDYELPLLTQRVMAVGDAVNTWWPLILSFVALVVFAFKWAKRSPQGRYAIDKTMLRLPVVGGFTHKLVLSRFSKNFVMLFGAGVDIIRVLEMLQLIVGNSVIAKEIADARERVLTGETLAEAFEESPSFPPLVRRLIAVGESTGSLDTTLGKAAEYLDKEIPRKLKQIFTLAEAGIILILGGMIAVCALALLLPIFSVQSQIMK